MLTVKCRLGWILVPVLRQATLWHGVIDLRTRMAVLGLERVKEVHEIDVFVSQDFRVDRAEQVLS